MWIVERGAQIMEFVNSVLDSIGAIAKGNIGIVADRVEGALAKALPVAISFLASLLGLGGISDKIRSVIDTVRAPINKAVDFVVKGAIKTFKKLFAKPMAWAKGKYEKGKAWVEGKVEAGKEWARGKIEAGKEWAGGKVRAGKEWAQEKGEAAKEKVGDLLAWLRKKLGIRAKTPVSVGGEQHTLTAVIDSENAVDLVMASTPEALLLKLGKAEDAATGADKAKIQALMAEAAKVKDTISELVRTEKDRLEAMVKAGETRGWREEFKRSKQLIWQLGMSEIAKLAGKLGSIPAIEKVAGDRLPEIDKELADARKLLAAHEAKVEAAKSNALFSKGPMADDARSLPTNSPIVTPDQRTKMQSMGPCHHQGLPGCLDAPPYTPDHQPVSELMTIEFKGKPLVEPSTQRLYPQCRAHSNAQGAAVKNLRKRIKEYDLVQQRIDLLEEERKSWENK
jgi:hypothetical protein